MGIKNLGIRLFLTYCILYGQAYLAVAQKISKDACLQFKCESGAVIRGDAGRKKLALVFTGDEFADGGIYIHSVLKRHQVPGSFFFTGNFYRNKKFENIIRSLLREGWYLGPHSDKHLLYCDWQNRDSLLVTQTEFTDDLKNNYREMKRFGISENEACYFLPPFEWYNRIIAVWTEDMDLQLVNYTPGTLSNADYTTPDMTNYKSSETIYKSIIAYEEGHPEGLNGFILLTHIGTAPQRKDKFYHHLEDLIVYLKAGGYEFQTIDQLLAF